MHDRGDYKAGWEIERDWNAQQVLLDSSLLPDPPPVTLKPVPCVVLMCPVLFSSLSLGRLGVLRSSGHTQTDV